MKTQTDLVKHNERVLHVLERLMGIVSSETAIQWMLIKGAVAGGRLGSKRPVEMIDNDEDYQFLLDIIERLESGNPS